MHVLLVEDDDLLRICLAELMAEAGFKVVGAPDAESALELAGAEQPPRVVVSDVNLGPGMDGFALAAAARRRWPTVPVLLMSGVDANFAGRHCGATERFLSKPFSSNAFLRSIAALTGKPEVRPA